MNAIRRTPFRILSLDGGGTWALLQAMALEQVYGNLPGRRILEHFDMAAANSGGSIVLAGLMLDWTPQRIVDFFADPTSRDRLFVSKWGALEGLARRLKFVPRYVAAAKLSGLRALMGPEGEAMLDEFPLQDGWPKGPDGAKLRCLITSFDYDRQRADFYRNYAIARLGTDPDGGLRLCEAVHASTDAPVTFFDRPAMLFEGRKQGRKWDGAMGGYNNPLMAAVTDAVALGIEPERIAALTIGTGSVNLLPFELKLPETPANLVEPRKRVNLKNNIITAGTTILDDPPDAATFIAHVLTARKPEEMGRVVRMNPWLVPDPETGMTRLYDEEKFLALSGLNMDATRQVDVDLIRELGQKWIETPASDESGDIGTAWHVGNQPVRQRRDLSARPGDPTFRDARRRWLAL